ncbi:MAG: NADPH:quinone oxidoreductase family protein [Pseudoruegeria sp.]
MKAFQILEYNRTQIREIDIPTPKPGEILIKIEACALNFADTLMVAGRYQEKPTFPFSPGLEFAGTVQAKGDAIHNFAVGDRVSGFSSHGGLAQYGCFPADACVVCPDEMSLEHAAAFQIAYGTSLCALSHRAQMHPGETLLVTGAAGGVGLTAIEIGKLMGARVIASARGQDKLDIAQKAGADHLIDSDTEDLRSAVKALGGADVVYETIGGAVFSEALRAMNPEGRMIPIGFAGGDVPQIPANHLLVKNLTVIGLYWGGYTKFAPEVIAKTMKQLNTWYLEGKLHPHISQRLPLSQTEDALDLLRSRKSTGKVVVLPWANG